jgi:hypothetical protein
MELITIFKNNKNVAFVVIFIILLWVIINIRCVSSMNDNLLTGFWKADPDFLDDSDLSSFVLYFAPSDWIGHRACYILAEKEDELVINEPCSVKITEPLSSSSLSISLDTKSYTVLFTDLETEEFPKKQNMVFNPNSGKIILSKGDVIYGVFFKDSYLTDMIYQDKIIKPQASESEDELKDEDL